MNQYLLNLRSLYEKERAEGEFDNFLNMLNLICENGNISFGIIVPFLSDNDSQDYLNEILVNNATYLFMQEEVESMASYIQNLLDKAPYKAEEIFSIILNSQEGISKFINFMMLIDKKELLKLFNLIEQESKHHRELIKKLRSELKV